MIRRKKTNNRHQSQKFIQANHYIRFPEVRVLTEHGEMLGVMPTSEALQKAQAAEKDLVLVTEGAKPPVVKIIDIAKHKYQLQQKKAEGRKKAKTQEIKEVRFTPFMGEGDFVSRLNKVKKFLEKGDKVRLSLQFRGRAITKKEFGYDLFNRVVEETAEIGTTEIIPKMMGKKLVAQLMPIKKK
ncbi:MAG: translation initiation factor IF-3 [Candidatus Pacebacteria bacterium]|nr:translation initiation factor IF-3 [Candidatus Paceibacterota bacterium]